MIPPNPFLPEGNRGAAPMDAGAGVRSPDPGTRGGDGSGHFVMKYFSFSELNWESEFWSRRKYW